MAGVQSKTAADGSALRKVRKSSSSGKGCVEIRSGVASGYIARFMDKGGLVDVDRVADAFRMSKGQLAQTAGLGVATVSKADRRTSPRAQTRVTEMLEVISRVRDWAGGEAQAMAWYRSQPIPALDGRTPEALVKSGKAGAVRDYLDHLALGGFA